MDVVIPFHKGDQVSAKYLLTMLMAAEEGTAYRYHLQYGDNVATLDINDIVLEFCSRKAAEFSCELPDVRVPEQMVRDDPNQGKYPQPHTLRSRVQKWKHLQWNLCLYKYINKLDSFLVLEPDSVILRHGWLSRIEAGFRNSKLPVYGHLKYGIIGGRPVPTHWAGSSVYNCVMLRELGLERYFYERLDNPWWPMRERPGTVTANNCFWGPVFSGYDISYDYFIYALYWMQESGSDSPEDWPDTGDRDASNTIRCDFHSRLSTAEVIQQHYDRLSLLHGIKADETRMVVTRKLAGPAAGKFIFPVGGPRTFEVEHESHSLTGLRDICRGEKCFIIGNGPSINEMDLAPLRQHFTFGLNRIYLNYEKMGFEPTFYCCVNNLVMEQFHSEIDRIKSIKFLKDGYQDQVRDHINTFFVDSLPGHDFNDRFESCSWYEGWTVTYCAMQVAYYLGFTTVILIGVDHNFPVTGKPNQEVEADGSDQNHFHPDYFGKGTRWHYPDLEKSEKSYRIAQRKFREQGRQILDATAGGRLRVFPRIEYSQALAGARAAGHGNILARLLGRPGKRT